MCDCDSIQTGICYCHTGLLERIKKLQDFEDGIKRRIWGGKTKNHEEKIVEVKKLVRAKAIKFSETYSCGCTEGCGDCDQPIEVIGFERGVQFATEPEFIKKQIDLLDAAYNDITIEDPETGVREGGGSQADIYAETAEAWRVILKNEWGHEY